MPLADHIEAETGWRSAWPLLEPVFDVPEDVRIPDDHWTEMVQGTEDMAFDLIEYFHGHVSEGIEDHEHSRLHTWERCGWHYGAFDPAAAQALFRQRMNRTLTKYRGGFPINQDGQIEHTADEGLDRTCRTSSISGAPDLELARNAHTAPSSHCSAAGYRRMITA